MSMYTLVSAATTNATVVRAGAARLQGIQCFNINAAAAYLKLYDKATTPSEADTPVKVILIPGATTGAGAAIPFHPFDNGAEFLSGLAFRVVTGITNASTAAVAASEVLINLDYK